MNRIVLLLTCLFLPSLILARDTKEQARIDFLLRTVESAKGITFLRNDVEHDGPAAAKHLRQKLARAGERVQTAEQFITHCASVSSLTKRRYKVRLANGTSRDAGAYLRERLREYDDAGLTITPPR